VYVYGCAHSRGQERRQLCMHLELAADMCCSSGLLASAGAKVRPQTQSSLQRQLRNQQRWHVWTQLPLLLESTQWQAKTSTTCADLRHKRKDINMMFLCVHMSLLPSYILSDLLCTVLFA
jgi:hypothetical protein